jgi:O-antigen ligase
VLGFCLVAYLGLQGGGYDVVVRNQVGIALWWIIGVGLVAGGSAFVVKYTPAAAAVWLALLLFGAWSAIALAWTGSPERTLVEVARNACYLAVFTVGLVAVARSGPRPLVNGVLAGAFVVASVALASRLIPSWFDPSATAKLLPSTATRLSYPINYWNGLGALCAMAIPLALATAASGRTLLGRALAGGIAPILGLTLFLTFSRGAALATAAALVVLLVVQRRRWLTLGVLVVAAASTGVVVAAAEQRPAVEDGLRTALARSEGGDLLALLLTAAVATAFLTAAVTLVQRHATPARVFGRTAQRITAIALAAAVLITGAFVVGSSDLSARWREFKSPDVASYLSPGNRLQRFDSASGNGRYQYWSSAIDAGNRHPGTGTGPGTFEYWWSQHASIPSFVRNAHSLFAETFAELGFVGLAVLIGLFGVLAVGGVRSLRAARESDHAIVGAAASACVAFTVSAAIDWVWQLAVLGAMFFLLAAAFLATREGRERRRAAFVVLPAAVASVLALVISLTGAAGVRSSQAAAQAGQIANALSDATTASRVQPYAAAPQLQLALLYETAGDLRAAVTHARAAATATPSDWRIWFTLARLQAEKGDAKAAVTSYRHARQLNPTSPVFQSLNR